MKLIKDGKEYNLVNNGVIGYGYDTIVINNKVYELEPAEVEYADKPFICKTCDPHCVMSSGTEVEPRTCHIKECNWEPFDGKVILLTKKQAKEIVHLSETLGLKILNEIAEKTR